MSRFQQRISEAAVTAARNKIASGASLRSAAAEIPCAPSTLSVRIKKAEAADASARDRVPIGEHELAAAGPAEYVRELKRIALGHDPTASARDRLTAIKELLRLEPAASQPAAVGAVFNVHPDGRFVKAERDAVARAADGQEAGES